MVYTGQPRHRRGHSNDDSIGNRKRPQDVERNLPEDIGNRRVPGEDDDGDSPDDLGNRLGGPAPWSRTFLRGKGGRRGKRSPVYKDMEAIYAQQGEGVPRMFRPGFRATPNGELAALAADGSLKPLGMSAHTGERVGGGGGGPDRGERGEGGPELAGGPDEGMMDGEGRRKRRRRRKRRGEGYGGGPEVQGQAGAQHAGPPQGQPPQGGGHAGGHGGGHGGGFEEDDDGFRYQLKSDPEDKRKAALAASEEILKHSGRTRATATARVVQETHGPRVVVEIGDKGTDGGLFARGTAALSAMTFLVNKIINRYPDDRIRLAIVEAGTWTPAVPAPSAAAAAPPAPAAAAAPAVVPPPAPAAPPPAPVAPPAPPAAAVQEEEPEEEDEEEASGAEDAGDEGEEGDTPAGEEGGGEAEAPARKSAARRATATRTTTRKPAKRGTTEGTPVARRKVSPRKTPAK
ncbi:MAG: hypothetical protein HY904_21995 [Deltaproteobacteria bacterium]|nr:hypothetical protein [Deltaproteobacteria bacterium]